MTNARWVPVADHLLGLGRVFAAMGIPLRAGRLFDAHDREALAPPAIISEALAARFFPGRSPLGLACGCPATAGSRSLASRR